MVCPSRGIVEVPLAYESTVTSILVHLPGPSAGFELGTECREENQVIG